MANECFTLKIAGKAGQGVKSSGISFARFANRSGYHVYTYTEYPSIIKGGHNVMQINIADWPVSGPSINTQLLIALNQESVDLHAGELLSDSCLVFDGDDKFNMDKVAKGVNLCPVPLSRLAKQAGGGELLINTVALGAAAALMAGDLSKLKKLNAEEYSDKGSEVILANQQAVEHGYNFAQQNYQNFIKSVIKPLDNKDTLNRMIVNGNEAVALAAISAGLQFAAIYPMSPISNILHVLALHQEKYNYVYKQPEDELAAINMSLGASFAGARAMTATSGGGFCLMSEGYGLAGITETPLVIIEGMRGGPATGLPTWSGQGDLRFMLHAHQDDFFRIVLTPGDAQEAFELTMQAFNLAEKYQTPVVVLINKDICEGDQSVPVFDTANYQIDRGKMTTYLEPDYKRYKLADDGISPRSIPGVGNFFSANSDEHDEYGLTSEDIENRNQQMEKRMKKIQTCQKEDMHPPQLFGPQEADLTIVSWGSNKGSICQALQYFDNVNYLHLTWVSPFPSEEVKKVLSQAKKIINIEANFTMQMRGIIKEQTGFDIKDNFIKYDGRPFYVEEVIEKIKSVLKEESK